MKQKLLKTWLMLVLMLVGAGTMWATDVVYKTALFGSSYNSKGVSSYTGSFSATNNGFTVDLANFNNNNNGWDYVKTGNKTSESVGTITTNAAIDKAITKIDITIDAISNSNVNSIYVYAGTSASNCPTRLGTFEAKSGVQTITVETPVENMFYKISFDCKKASSNGVVQVSKVEYYVSDEGGSTPTKYNVTIANNIENGTVTASSTSAASGDEITLSATPADGYEFGSWSVTDASSNAITVTNNKFTMPASNVNVSATFNKTQGGGDEPSGDVLSVDFENEASTYSDWTFTNITTKQTNDNVDAHGDSYFGTTAGKATGSIQTKDKVNPETITFYISKTTTNTTSSSWKVQTSTNGTSWTDAKTVSASSVTRGAWTEVTHTFSNVSDVYVRVYYDGSTAVRCIDDLTLTLAGNTPPAPDKELIAIQADGTPAEFWKGDAFNHNGITVTALWDDETETDVTSSCEFSGYDMSTAGQQTVTVKYQGETCTYGIEVKTIANTQETAYTVAEAKALIDAGKDLATQVYVAGTVSSLGANKDGENAYNETYKSITYWLDENTFEVYSGKNLNNTDFSSAEELIVGDQVVIYGVIKKYSSIYEFDKNNYIVSLTHPAAKTITALEISGTPTKTTYNVGDAFETEGLVVTATYSDNTTAPITTGFDWEIDYGTGNEALVAGATSVDVMVYTEDNVMSEVFTVKGLTVNVPVTLTSIAVSGTPTKTEYYAGDAFDPAGLVVTGTYSDSHQETITEGIEWTFDPETLALETTSVEVLACVGSVVSEVYTVNGLTVTKPDFETVTYDFSSFTSGTSVELTDLDGFTITLKGNGGTNPAWSSNQARVYAKGSLTVSANNATIKSIEYVYTVNANSKGVTPTIDGVEGTTDAGSWDVENKTWTGADEEVTFSTSGTAGNIGFTKLIIKYVESSKITPTLSFSAPTAEVTIGANDNVFPTLTTTPADLEGVTFESSNTAVATINENTGAITLIAAGETTITAKYAGNEDYAAATPASYTLTVSKAPFVPTPVAEGYEDVDFTTVEPYKSLATNGSADMTTYEGTSFSAEFAKKSGTNNAPKFYQNGNAVRAYVDNTITITAAEPITNVNLAWVKNYADDAVSITGLGTTTAVVTFSKTCRFTDITVYYQQYTRSLTNAWGTICLPYDFKADATTTYYSITSVQMENDNPVAMALTKETELKAGVPYIFYSDNTEAGLTCVRAGKEVVTEPATVNGMTGSFTKHAIETGMYLLSGNKFVKVASGSNVGANRAYIDMTAVPTSSAEVKADVIFGFNGDITDGIMSVESNERNAQYVDLSGRRVMNPVKGLYIVNGKKVMIKK